MNTILISDNYASNSYARLGVSVKLSIPMIANPNELEIKAKKFKPGAKVDFCLALF